MKKVFITAGLVLCCMLLFAQKKQHTDVRNVTWNIIGLRTDRELSPGKWGSFYPQALKNLNNKIIELPGYIIPTKVGQRFSDFMFSMVPIASCPYCGTGDIPSMIEVKMQKSLEITEKPVRLKGLFKINDSGDDRSEFFLLNATLL